MCECLLMHTSCIKINMNYPYLWKIEFDLQYAISRLFSWMVKFVLSKPYGIICIKIFQHKNTNDLYTYRLKL